MTIFYSATDCNFYLESMKSDYVKAGSWPDDLVEVTESVFAEFTKTPPVGKTRGSDSNGMPAWVDIVRTPEELAAVNLSTAQSEYERATRQITALNEQIEDDDYTGTTEDSVKSSLAEWTNYRKQLRAYIKAGDGSQPLPSAPFN